MTPPPQQKWQNQKYFITESQLDALVNAKGLAAHRRIGEFIRSNNHVPNAFCYQGLTKEAWDLICQFNKESTPLEIIIDALTQYSKTPAPAAPERTIPTDENECWDFIPYPNDCCGLSNCRNKNCVYHPSMEHDATIRNQTLDDIMKFVCAYEDFIGLDNIDGFEIYGVKSVNLKEHIESLRTQENQR